MSYCRFSSDNFNSDVYVYEHIHGGWVTHVANYRHVNFDPCPALDFKDNDTLAKSFDAQRIWLKEAVLQKINLPSAGETFVDDTQEECAKRLLNLRREGFNVPQKAITTLLDEAHEQNPSGR